MNFQVFRSTALLAGLIVYGAGCSEPLEQRGLSLLEEGHYEEAILLLKPAVAENPTDPKLNTVYGAALLRNNQPSLALWPLRRAFQESGETGPSGHLLVEAMISGGASREGIELATRLLEADPENRRLRSMRARAYSASLDKEGALADIDLLAEASPDDPQVLETRVNLLTEMDRLEEAAAAIQELKKLLEARELPPDAMARFCGAEGEFLRKHGEADEAEAHFSDCLEKFPGSPDVVNPAWEFYESIDQHDRAVQMLIDQAALPQGKTRLRIQGLLAQAFNQDGRHDEAEAVLLEFAREYNVPQSWLELADHYASVDQMSQAAEALEKAIEIENGLSPGDSGFSFTMLSEDTRFAYADILIQLGNFDRVKKILRHIEEPAHKLLIEGRLKLEEGDPQGALDTYQEAFKHWASNPGARYLAAVAALRLGQLDLAEEFFQESMRADSRTTDAGLILARMKSLSGQHVGVYETAGFYLRGNPENLEATRMMMLAAGTLGGEKAAEGLRDVIVAMGEEGKAVADYANLTLLVEGRQAALEYLKSVENLDEPGLAHGLMAWMNLMLADGRGEEALERVLVASDSHPDSALLQVAKGAALQAMAGESAEIEKSFARAIELDSELPDAHVAMGQQLIAQGEIDLALVEFDRAREIDPREPLFGYLAAAALFDAERKDEAESRLQEQLKAHPWHGDSAARLARLAFDRGDTGPETLALARVGAQYGPNTRQFSLQTLGLVRLAREEYSEGQAILRKAINLGNASPSTFYYLARSLARTGNGAEAMKFLEESLQSKNFPEIEDARTLRTDLEARQKNRS